MTREEAITYLEDAKSNLPYKFEQAIDMAIKSLLAEVARGEWEHWGSPFSDESEVIDTIVCSVCGVRFIEPKDEPKGEYNYCPNCGADMRGEENEVEE